MDSQEKRLRELDVADGESWVLILDAGRPDVFQELYPEYLDGEYETVYNGGHFHTASWFTGMFSYLVDGHLFHGGQPISAIFENYEYDEEDYFSHVPSASVYEFEQEPETWATSDPHSVNEVVRRHLPNEGEVNERLKHLGYTMSAGDEADPDLNMNVVRYLQPHAPYRSITEFGDHRSGIRERVRDEDAEFTHADWREAYEDNYRWGLEAAADLAETLKHRDARVVITADHGECLGDCGQWFHGQNISEEHDHMVGVPWLEVN